MSDLPELPPPSKNFGASEYTASQMRSYGLSCARAAMERAAQIAEDTIVAEYEGVDCYGDKAAAAIRAEMSKETL